MIRGRAPQNLRRLPAHCPGQAAEAPVDTAGIRTRRGDDAQVYDQQLKLLQDGGTAYLWAPDGTLLAQQDDEGAVLTATTDLAGSVTAMRDASGAVTAQYGYTTFGARTLTAGVDVTVIGYRSEQHGATGLIYLRARHDACRGILWG